MSDSTERRQSAGISQGCPLSPFLFVMIMSVIMFDTVSELGGGAKQLLEQHRLAAILYADDTLLIGPSKRSLEELLFLVAAEGKAYGLEFH